MEKLLAFAVPGLFTGAAYAIAASGLVLTYTTTRVFNVAHGAFGMVMAFVFWDFSQRQGLPVWLSLLLVLGVVAPLTGLLVQRFVARGLGEAPVGVSLVVTVGLFVGLIGLAQQIWPPDARFLPPFLPETSLELGPVVVTGHQLITIACSVLVAGGLYVLLNRTRIGTSMRASVDNPELLQLFGGRPDRVASLAWAIGMSLSALGGILLASVVGLDYYQLTLLVVNAYAAAMVGRLRSLPLTFAGAMGLGLLDSFALGYIPPDSVLADLRPVIPALFLFAVIVLLPTAQLRIGQVKGQRAAPVPSLNRSLAVGVLAVLAVSVLAVGLSETSLLRLGIALTYALVMLSLVLLTGYGGFVSLSQLTFAGVGALAYAKLDDPTLGGLLLAAVITGVVGALVALPVLRLTGLYLALSTLAFGVLMDKLVFQSELAFGFNGSLEATRPAVLGLEVGTTGGYVVLMTAVLVLVAIALLAVRRGPVGRVLVAIRDSPAACGTLGLDTRFFRVGVFAASAAIAGLAGALFAGLRGLVGAAEFQYFNSLPLLLLVVVFGVTSVTGAVLGGIGLMLLPVLQADNPSVAGLIFAVIGFGAVALGRDPNGLSNRLFTLGRWAAARLAQELGDSRPGVRRRPGSRARREESEQLAAVVEEVGARVAARG